MANVISYDEHVNGDVDSFDPSMYEEDDDRQVIEATQISDLMDAMQNIYNASQLYMEELKKSMGEISDIVGIAYPPEVSDMSVVADIMNGKV